MWEVVRIWKSASEGLDYFTMLGYFEMESYFAMLGCLNIKGYFVMLGC